MFRSHLVVVPPSPNLTDALRTSPIVQGEDGYTPSGGADFGSGFDVDPNLDPELALVSNLILYLKFKSVILFVLNFLFSESKRFKI